MEGLCTEMKWILYKQIGCWSKMERSHANRLSIGSGVIDRWKRVRVVGGKSGKEKVRDRDIEREEISPLFASLCCRHVWHSRWLRRRRGEKVRRKGVIWATPPESSTSLLDNAHRSCTVKKLTTCYLHPENSIRFKRKLRSKYSMPSSDWLILLRHGSA